MSSARDIKRRIKSVKSTQQITKAMNMVAAAKLRKSQAAVVAVRPFTRKIEQMILHISESVKHPYLQEKAEVKKVCYVVIGSDRGLCGGFNGNLNRFLSQRLAEEEREYELIVIGRKLREYCQSQGYPIARECTGIGDNPSFCQAHELAEQLRRGFDEEAYGEVSLVYSQFKSAMVQSPRLSRLLPVSPPEPVNEEYEDAMFLGVDYIFEPSREAVLEAILPQYVDIGVYCALQEAKASEHGARMTAMSSATDNATEMIGHLTLSLNRARQAAITTEISEIVGGAAALS